MATDESELPALLQQALDKTEAMPSADSKVLALIDEWFTTHFSNSIVSRDTEIFNLVHAAKEDLKRRVSQGDH
jgi:hypothetical protein